jgi:hypothetical protein
MYAFSQANFGFTLVLSFVPYVWMCNNSYLYYTPLKLKVEGCKTCDWMMLMPLCIAESVNKYMYILEKFPRPENLSARSF